MLIRKGLIGPVPSSVTDYEDVITRLRGETLIRKYGVGRKRLQMEHIQ